MDKAEVLMHPVRMRMISALSRNAQTVQQLAKELGDVATPTLYHHLNLLVKAGLVQVVKEEQKRGTYEKTYAVVEGSTVLNVDDLAQTAPDELMRYFQIFVGNLLGDYARYLQDKKDTDYGDMGYRQLPLYLSDEEFTLFSQELNTFFKPWLAYQPSPERRLRALSMILISMQFPQNDLQRALHEEKEN
jgi:DNA-binding transcriptional ArsR family regulator